MCSLNMDVNAAKANRRYSKSSVTHHVNTLSRLVAEGDATRVRAQLDIVRDAFDKFENDHYHYHSLLSSDTELDESELYFLEQYKVYMLGLKEAKAWLEPLPGGVVKWTPGHSSASAPESLTSDLINILSLPKVEIPTFTGIPKDYQSFMAIFRESVESKITDGQARLTRLLYYTDGWLMLLYATVFSSKGMRVMAKP